MTAQPVSATASTAGTDGVGTTRACDACRKKKIKCEPTKTGCAQCTKYRTKCHFTPIAMKRKPRKPAGFKYIAQLEERLQEVEGLLGSSATKSTSPPSSEQTAPIVPLDTEGHATSPDSAAWMTTTESQTWTTEQPNILPFDLTLAYPNKHTTDTFLNSLTIDPLAGTPLLPSHPTLLLPHQQLPPKPFALTLIHETLTHYNRYLPLFDENDFLTEFHLKYSISHPSDAGWWACLNVVLSIAHRLRALRTLDTVFENSRACTYVQNALDVVSELNVANISAVQALVGMACILQGTPNSEPASMLVAAALRLAQAMNLHREPSNSSFTEQEAEKRRRVFWKVYILDKDISLRTGRPFGQDDDDMDVRLPSTTGLDSCNVDLFNCRIALAMIQGQVYKQLYSIRAERQTETERSVAAQGLSSVLAYWRLSAHMDAPEGSTVLNGDRVAGEMVHKVVLRLTYIHCLTMIDRHLRPGIQEPHNQSLVLSSSCSPGETCLLESREAIRLVQAIPPGDSSCVWMLLHAFLAAATSLLNSIAQTPHSPTAQSDLRLVKPFLRLLEQIVKSPHICSESSEVGRMLRTLSNLDGEARTAVRLFGSMSSVTVM